MLNAWIVSDMDGTLLNSRHEITRNTAERITGYIQAGGQFTIATGRILRSALPYIEQLELTQPVILYNGGMIYDPVKRSIVEQSLLPQASVDFSLRCFASLPPDHGLALIMFSEERLYCTEITGTVQALLRKEQLEVELCSVNRMAAMQANKLMVMGEPEELQPFMRHCDSQLTDRMRYVWNPVNSEATLLEIIPPLTNKGTALKRLVQLVRGNEADFVAVGDNLNDMEMVALAGRGVAVRNAHPKLKDVAVRVTEKTNDEDAMTEIIDWLESS